MRHRNGDGEARAARALPEFLPTGTGFRHGRAQRWLRASCLLAASILALPLIIGCGPSLADLADASQQEIPTQAKTVLSPVYVVDQIYPSMMGPADSQKVQLSEDEGLVWIVGFDAVMVGPDGEEPRSQEFMCHSNLDLDVEAHQRTLGANLSFNPRLFTLSQGQLSVRFPEGFGIPVLGTEALELNTQVLNHNLEDQTVKVRHRIAVEYVRQADLERPLVPLFTSAAYGLKLLTGEDGYYGVQQPEGETHGPGCLVGNNASSHVYEDPFGREFTGHWVVPPGREENRTLVTKLMQLPYATTIHYIAVHLHPFAESLTLRDLTTGETLFKSEAEGFVDKVGLARVQHFTSTEGIEVHPDHEYEIVSVYNNTTDEPQDSMAVMYLYLRDRVFEKKILQDRERRKELGIS